MVKAVCGCCSLNLAKSFPNLVPLIGSGSIDLFHQDKVTIVVACSSRDYKEIKENLKDDNTFVIKANPLCEI